VCDSLSEKKSIAIENIFQCPTQQVFIATNALTLMSKRKQQRKKNHNTHLEAFRERRCMRCCVICTLTKNIYFFHWMMRHRRNFLLDFKQHFRNKFIKSFSDARSRVTHKNSYNLINNRS
jgi:hypothetical protein